jgi:hypothetical protein
MSLKETVKKSLRELKEAVEDAEWNISFYILYKSHSDYVAEYVIDKDRDIMGYGCECRNPSGNMREFDEVKDLFDFVYDEADHVADSTEFPLYLNIQYRYGDDGYVLLCGRGERKRETEPVVAKKSSGAVNGTVWCQMIGSGLAMGLAMFTPPILVWFGLQKFMG